MAELDHIGNRNLRELPLKLCLKIENILNTGKCWQRFISSLDSRYTLDDDVMMKLFEKARPADDLIKELCALDMTIQDFVSFSAQAQIHPILTIFGMRVPARITQQPFPFWNVTVGESLSFEVQATGTPVPLFQWFKDNLPIPNANRNRLSISSLREAHSGTYICQVKNGPPQDPGLQSNPVQVCVAPAKPLVITVQPCSTTVAPQGIALLRCEVEGDGNIHYQWMRNGKELADDDRVSGSSTNQLKIDTINNEDYTGCYFCRISRGEEFIFTQDAVVQIGFIQPELRFTATDKVALLLGAGDYRSESSLNAPRNDVQTMAAIFERLNFKVVALLDLTKQEMLAAIHEFKHLVGEGVYCVFYFCGHGFEAGSQCFLLPPDAPLGNKYSHCLSVDDILLNDLLPQKPKICVMILDVCRLNYDGPLMPGSNNPPDGEYVLCYATAQGLYSYEKKNTGIFVSHLRNILLDTIGVEEVFTRLRQEIREDPVFLEEEANGEKKRQIPEVRTILSEPGRSFHDEIDATGCTEEFNARQLAWENAHRTPAPRDIIASFPGFDVTINLEFRAELSNVLTIFLSVKDKGNAKICNAYITEIPADVAEKAQNNIMQEGTETSQCKNFLPLHSIQRLREAMVIKITVICILHDNTEVSRYVEEDLGRPLVSPLNLWRDSPSLHRCLQAEEADYREYGELV